MPAAVRPKMLCMKIRFYMPLLCTALLCTTIVYAGDRPKIRFDYDVTFSTTFDNREYDKSELDYSCTLFGLRAQTAVGVSIGKEGRSPKHRLLGGVDPLYEFGGGWKIQPLLYYQFTTHLERSRFEIVAGAFPRAKSGAYYSEAFYSSRTKFLDDTYEGLQFSWRGRNFYYEVGVDWMGQIRQASPATREQFAVYSGGHHYFPFGLKLGYSAYLHHYACSMLSPNVVDDVLLNPYVEMNVGHWLHMQSLTARIGYLQAVQRDRYVSKDYFVPAKGEFFLEARKWNVGIFNDFFVGGDMMPLFNAVGPDGVQYGQNLYMGDPFLRNPVGVKCGIYDKVALYYEPDIVKKLHLRIQAEFHFNNAGYQGTRQVIAVSYDL